MKFTYLIKTSLGYVYSISADGISTTSIRDDAMSGDYDSMDILCEYIEHMYPHLKPDIFLKEYLLLGL